MLKILFLISLLFSGVVKAYEIKKILGPKISYCRCVPTYQCETNDETNNKKEVYELSNKNKTPACTNSQEICCLIPDLRLNNRPKKNESNEVDKLSIPSDCLSLRTRNDHYSIDDPIVSQIKSCSNLVFFNDLQSKRFWNTINVLAQLDWSVYIENESSVKICEGFLVDEKIVLTIGNCVNRGNEQDLKISLQKWSLRHSSFRQPRKVTKILYHPEYNFNSPSNNLALLFLDKPFDSIDNVKVMCLPDKDETYVNHHRCMAKKYNFEQDFHQTMQSVVVPSSTCDSGHVNGTLMCTYSYYDSDIYTITQSSPIYCPASNDSLRYKVAGLIFSPMSNDHRVPFQVSVDLSKAHDWISNGVKKIDVPVE